MWRYDSTQYQPLHTQACYRVLARIPHMDARVSDGKLEILAYVRVETHDIHILDSLVFLYFIVEPHGLRPSPIQSVTGTWVMDEVRMAVEKVYRILDVYEIYEYQVTQYNPETGEGGLFVDYINKFLKLNAEASGYSGRVRSPDDEVLYVESLWTKVGISLDRESIKSNAAKRGLAKLPQLHVGKIDREE